MGRLYDQKMGTPLNTPLEHLRVLGVRNRGVIQIGANSGQEVEDYAAHGLRHALLVEPQTEPFAQLQEAVRPHKHFHAVQALCAEEEAEVDFHVAANSVSSSTLRPKDHLDLYPTIRFNEVLRLHTTTVDAVVADFLGSHSKFTPQHFDLLVVDVQGAEIRVLRGAEKTLEAMRAVICEVSYAELYEGGASLEDVVAFMAEHKFKMFWLSVRRKLWGEALFVHKDRAWAKL